MSSHYVPSLLVGAYEILDHGFHHAQYFQGAGTYGSKHAYIVMGAGNNQAEALQDALQALAEGGYAGADLIEAAEKANYDDFAQFDDGEPEPVEPDAQKFSTEEDYAESYEQWESDHEEWEARMENSEHHYYLSIRFSPLSKCGVEYEDGRLVVKGPMARVGG